MNKWLQRQRFLRAYLTLRKIADVHRKQGHVVEFYAVNSTDISLCCLTCNPA